MVPRSRWAFALAGVLLLSSCSGGNGAAGGSGGTSGAGGNGGSAGTDGMGGAGGAPRLPPASFVENLLQRVADGEWTLGEGLVATLQAVAGEIDTSMVLRHPELLNAETTGIIAMAYEYLEDGEDEDAKEEIGRLLDLRVFDEDQLNAMAGEGPTTMPVPALKDAETDCAKFFKDYQLEVPAGVSVCLGKSSVTIDGEVYSVFVPLSTLPQAGWTEDHFTWTNEMINEVVPVYNGLGEMPNVIIVFSVLPSPLYWAEMLPASPDLCLVTVFTGSQSLPRAEFKQILAHEMGHCFQEKTFTAQNQVKYVDVKWREEGLAEHLSNVAYKETNFEWRWLPQLAFYELSRTLFERESENAAFFQYLASRLSDSGVIALVKTLPTMGGKSDQINALAGYKPPQGSPDMQTLYHDFALALTDREVVDTSGVPLPYPINQSNQRTLVLDRFGTITKTEFEPFGVSRILLTVEPDHEASVAFVPSGSVEESTRTPSADDWGTLPDAVPDNCADVITVVTTVGANSGFKIEVPEVFEVPGICNLEGTWVVDNESLDLAPTAWELEETFGEMRITFGDDGVAEVVYAGWGYRNYKDTQLSVGGIDVLRHEEFIHTTDATGTTPYEVDGDQIRFDEFFESAYLEGTETVRQIREFNPPNTIGPDIDETTTESADGRGLFAGIRTYELEGGTLRFLSPINGSVDGVLFYGGNSND